MVKAGRPGRRRRRLDRWGKIALRRIDSTQTRVNRATHLEARARQWAEKALAELERLKPEADEREVKEIKKNVESAETVIREAIENWGSLMKNQGKMVRDAEKAGSSFGKMFRVALAELEKKYKAKIGEFQRTLRQIEQLKRKKRIN